MSCVIKDRYPYDHTVWPYVQDIVFSPRHLPFQQYYLIYIRCYRYYLVACSIFEQSRISIQYSKSRIGDWSVSPTRPFPVRLQRNDQCRIYVSSESVTSHKGGSMLRTKTMAIHGEELPIGRDRRRRHRRWYTTVRKYIFDDTTTIRRRNKQRDLEEEASEEDYMMKSYFEVYKLQIRPCNMRCLSVANFCTRCTIELLVLYALLSLVTPSEMTWQLFLILQYCTNIEVNREQEQEQESFLWTIILHRRQHRSKEEYLTTSFCCLRMNQSINQSVNQSRRN